MGAWEYAVRSIPVDFKYATVESWLNQAGADEWELVSVVHQVNKGRPDDMVLFLRRSIGGGQ